MAEEVLHAELPRALRPVHHDGQRALELAAQPQRLAEVEGSAQLGFGIPGRPADRPCRPQVLGSAVRIAKEGEGKPERGACVRLLDGPEPWVSPSASVPSATAASQ